MGMPATGKSHLTCYLMEQFTKNKFFKTGIAFTPYDVENDDESLSFMPKNACTPYSKEKLIAYYDNMFAIKEMKEKEIDKMTDTKKEIAHNFIIFEDSQGRINFNDNDLLNLLNNFRKTNTCLFFIMHQISRSFGDYLKAFCNCACIFNYTDKKNIHFLNEAFGGGDFTDKQFVQFLREHTSERHSFLMLIKNHPEYGRLWLECKAGKKNKNFKLHIKLFPLIKKKDSKEEEEEEA
jgi:hypothetical protein